MKQRLFWFCVVALACWPATVLAEWSVVAVNRQSRLVGAAGASCEVGLELGLGLLPGRGVVMAQADTGTDGLERAMALLGDGMPPPEIISAIATEEFDPAGWFGGSWEQRQYAIAALDVLPPVSAFTGTEVGAWRGAYADRYFAIQGNHLAGEAAMAAAIDAYKSPIPVRSGRCRISLADRLLRAVEAVANAGGDTRCGKYLANSAFLVVAQEGDDAAQPSISLVVPRRMSQLESLWYSLFDFEPDPDALPAVRELRMRYAEWMLENPPICAEGQ